MDSLIEAVEKKFEANTPLSYQTRLAHRLFKFHLFRRVLAASNKQGQREAVISYLSDVSSELENLEPANAEPLFTNVLSLLYSENAMKPIEDIQILGKFASISLDFKMNGDVKKLLEIGLNSQFMISEHVDTEEERAKRTKFFEICSKAYNLTRNLDKALALLRKVEQREDMSFSVILFNNVIDC